MLNLLKRLTPLGRVLMGIAGLVLVAVVVVFSVTMFGGTTLYHHRGDNNDTYTWQGGPLLIERVQDQRSTCTVEPDSGESRGISANRTRSSLRTYSHDTVEPWFDGTATISCTRDAKVYTGTIATLRSFQQGHLFTLVIGVGIALPAVGALAVSGLRRKK